MHRSWLFMAERFTCLKYILIYFTFNITFNRSPWLLNSKPGEKLEGGELKSIHKYAYSYMHCHPHLCFYKCKCC